MNSTKEVDVTTVSLNASGTCCCAHPDHKARTHRLYQVESCGKVG